MKCAVLIQARSASVRLPGKIYEPVPDPGSPSILDHVVRRMQLANVGQVVVLIPEDDSRLADYLTRRAIEFI
ncbi:MAG TPA: spore coat biosynthesis protein F, partial [Leptospiraceae bacterium]|nr:spore coat biosynthesis protein F [Leptospiraceae bacterium]